MQQFIKHSSFIKNILLNIFIVESIKKPSTAIQKYTFKNIQCLPRQGECFLAFLCF